MTRFVFIVIMMSASAACGATINAASVSYSDVTNAIGLSSNGDTVVVPAGTAIYTETLVIPKAITLQGAGIGQTIIQDGISAYGTFLLNVILVEDLNTRITGIEFENGSGSYSAGSQVNRIRISGTSIDDRRIRFDNCKIDELNGPAFVFYTALGVVDHNIVLAKSSGMPAFLGHVINSSWGRNQDVGAWGDGAYTNANEFGTERFLFFEDNNITNLYTTSPLTMLDGHSGARYVFRYNNVVRGSMEIHGSEAARARSGRAYDIYGNLFWGNDVRDAPIYMRGGVGRVHSNNFVGWTSGAKMALLDNRANDHLFSPVWGITGRNPWDINNAGNPFDTATVTSAGTLTVTDSAKSWTVNQWANYIIRRTSGKSVSSLTRSGSTATVSATGHGFSTDDYVSIWGANQNPFNGLFRVTVTDANTFTFTILLPPTETTATGTILCAEGNNFAHITSNTGTQITFAGSAFGSARYLAFAASDTFEINKVDQSMDQNGVIGGTDLAGVDVPTVWSNTQTASPWYEWSNTSDNAGSDIDFSTSFSGGSHANIVSGTHFHNDTFPVGYTSYTYPHPLVSGDDPDPPASVTTTIGTLVIH